jgi:DNA-binding NtrC family response regulator
MKENPAQLVILDLDMPGMGGEACLRELMAMDPLIKVIISTGFAHRGQAALYRASGASGFLAKPYGVSRLLRLVRQVLDRSPEAGGEQSGQPEDETIISS